MMLMFFYRVSHKLYNMKVPLLPKLIYYFSYLMFNSIVPPSCEIGKGTKFGYGGIGLVIHANSKIGENCIIGQGITIGGRSKQVEVPVIGNNVFIGAGARILGPIEIGSEVVIGPNSVVIDSVPSNSIVVGFPAKVIKECEKMRDFV